MKILFLIFLLSIQVDAFERDAKEWEQRALDSYHNEEYSNAIKSYEMASKIYHDLDLDFKVIEIAAKQASIHEQLAMQWYRNGFHHLEIDSYKYAAVCYKKAGNILKVAEIFEKMAVLLLQQIERVDSDGLYRSRTFIRVADYYASAADCYKHLGNRHKAIYLYTKAIELYNSCEHDYRAAKLQPIIEELQRQDYYRLCNLYTWFLE